MIDVHDLTFAYPDGTLVFEGFDWSVAAGEAWAVLGPSGCGKTTLLYLLAGLRRSGGGEIRVGGEPLLRPRPGTGLILQDFGLLPWATVRENAALGLRLRGFYGPDGTHAPRAGAGLTLTPAAIDAQVRPWLERLGIAAIAKSFPSQISGGQRQRTAIARTFALAPDLLLMDEPFAALDAPTRESLQNLTLQLRLESGLTMVVVTHTIEEAALLGERVLVLGRRPNCSAGVFENSGAARPEFRETAAYASACSSLRRALEAAG